MDGDRDDGGRIEEVERENRILRVRLARSEANRDRLEKLKDSHDTLQREVIAEVRRAREVVESANEELERRVRERTEELTVLNEALVRTRDEALAGNQAKSYFLATMSHELRTPLNTIIGYSELVGEIVDEGRSAAAEHRLSSEASVIDGDSTGADIRRVTSAAHHLLSIIDDVLDLSKIEAGTTRMSYDLTDLRRFFDEVGETARAMARLRHNRIVLSIDELPPRCVVDRTKLRQVVLNLLSNAVKFTERGTVELSVRRSANWVEIAVRDSGIGIDPADFGKLFRPFSQVEAAANRRFEGTGLGLALTKKYCQMLGGDVVVESTLGVGSTFTVALPLCPPQVAALRGPMGDEEVVLSPEMPPVVVLDRGRGSGAGSGVEALVGALRVSGAEVSVARSPRVAAARVEEDREFVLLLDVIGEDMSGWAALEQLTSEGVTVVVLSGVDCSEAVLRRGASGFVQAPAELGDLLCVLCEAGSSRGRGGSLGPPGLGVPVSRPAENPDDGLVEEAGADV